jgi:beta-phosphoglucomutase-like phosphatase (HAD superfamily)
MATTQGFVVDNSPLGVEAANKAGLECNITLNKTPLDIHNDFNGVTPSDPGKCYLKR